MASKSKTKYTDSTIVKLNYSAAFCTVLAVGIIIVGRVTQSPYSLIIPLVVMLTLMAHVDLTERQILKAIKELHNAR